MSRTTRRALLGAALAAPSLALSQGRFPDKPLRVFVPWTPGGATDIQMRTVCEIASRHLGSRSWSRTGRARRARWGPRRCATHGPTATR
jgi:tripartite-type tricarboxylate transporter receptor subunit TctC